MPPGLMQPRLALPACVVFLLALALGACAPSLSPLYRDYEVAPAEPPIVQRIEAALAEAGWQTAPASAPNAVATEERKMSSWGLYTVVVSLEVVPVGDAYVRLYVHPYRKYFTGGRGKIPYLNKTLQRAVLRDLNAAFEKQGLRAVGTSVERDRRATSR